MAAGLGRENDAFRHRGAVTALAVATALLATPMAGAWAACEARGNGAVLTVAGAISNTNRPALDEKYDHFLKYRGHKFDAAHVFSIDTLAALPQRSIDGYLAYDGKRHHFDGPSLNELLTAVGATAGFTKVTLQALDGYEVAFTPAQLAKDDQVLALCMDDKPLGLGGLGPIYTVIPLAEGQGDIDHDQQGRQIWGLMFVDVK